MGYDREKALAYAHRWAYSRNPAYYDFSGIGGDCTNFISQCLYAGCGVMNYRRETGWYYNSASDRSAAWSGVPYLYNFLTANSGAGPYGHLADDEETTPGDVIQLSFDGAHFSHTLFVVETADAPTNRNIFVATHTYDADYRRLDTYSYAIRRLIHIDGSR